MANTAFALKPKELAAKDRRERRANRISKSFEEPSIVLGICSANEIFTLNFQTGEMDKKSEHSSLTSFLRAFAAKILAGREDSGR
jgi:hypothetical protein